MSEGLQSEKWLGAAFADSQCNTHRWSAAGEQCTIPMQSCIVHNDCQSPLFISTGSPAGNASRDSCISMHINNVMHSAPCLEKCRLLLKLTRGERRPEELHVNAHNKTTMQVTTVLAAFCKGSPAGNASQKSCMSALESVKLYSRSALVLRSGAKPGGCVGECRLSTCSLAHALNRVTTPGSKKCVLSC